MHTMKKIHAQGEPGNEASARFSVKQSQNIDCIHPFSTPPGAHNEVESGRKGRSVKRPHKKLKTFCSPVTIF